MYMNTAMAIMNSAVIELDFIETVDEFEKRRKQHDADGNENSCHTPLVLICLMYSVCSAFGKRFAILQWRNSMNIETE